jgi:hypothetical protein
MGSMELRRRQDLACEVCVKAQMVISGRVWMERSQMFLRCPICVPWMVMGHIVLGPSLLGGWLLGGDAPSVKRR